MKWARNGKPLLILKGDLIQVFILLKGLDQINYNNFFVLDVTPVAGVTHWKLLRHARDSIFGCLVLAIELLIVGIILRLKSSIASQ